MSGEKVDDELHNDIIVIVCAVLVHYILEFGKEMGDYSCPPYCEVKHEHIKEDIEDELEEHK